MHYLPFEKQKLILKKCNDNLNEKGIIVIKDADASLDNKHRMTEITEFISTKFSFNKVDSTNLFFFNLNLLESFSKENNLEFEILKQSKTTSNRVILLKK